MARLDQFSASQAAEGARGFSLPGTLAQRWNACLVAACGLAVLLGGYAHRWANDDALIYTRAVRQILAGNGPVYNIGERAESSTGTLWQWMLVAGSAVPGVADPLRLAVALGLLLTVAGYLLALDGTRRLWRLRHPSGALLPVGVLVLLPLRAAWDYATSGLETGLSFFWLGLCWWLLVRARGGAGRTDVTVFVFGLGPLVRPDLTLVTVVFLTALWVVERPSRRSLVKWACVAGALPFGYEVFRAGYYGVLVPLPAIAKEASETQWQFGFDYLRNTVVPYHLWVPLLLLAAYGAATALRARGQGRTPGRRPDLRDRARQADVALVGAPVLAGLLSAFFVAKVGGDFMHGRMVLPALFLVMLPVALLPYGRETRVLSAALAVWAVACAALFRPPMESPEPRVVYDSHRVYQRGLAHPYPTSQAVHVEHDLPFTAAVRTAQRAQERHGTRGLVLETVYDEQYPALPLAPHVRAGLAGAEARLGNAGAVLPLDALAVDTLGLANPLGAHTLPTRRFKAGHEKPLNRAWIVADLTPPGTPLPAYVDPLRVRAARHALTCGRLAELQASVRAPMTPGRFFQNLGGAWSRTQFRIPADPVAAERQVCGGR
ncbi:hypothetical protein [Streptomyces sp. NPDC048172]|uniref:hypothetical protein n=1 Tax=Streptomyces sp. NPDC048172 TaxID=3365505 RepID=UPI00371244B1